MARPRRCLEIDKVPNIPRQLPVPIQTLAVMLSAAWLGSLLAAPWWPAAPAALLYAAASLVCHQIPERSFHLHAAQLPVCARCLGIYGGVAAAALVMGVAARLAPTNWRASDPRAWLVVSALPTAVTVAAEWVGWWDSSNLVRLVAGVPLGAGVARVVIGELATLHYGQCPPRPPAAPSRLR